MARAKSRECEKIGLSMLCSSMTRVVTGCVDRYVEDSRPQSHRRGVCNRRAEMYFTMAEWVKRGGQLPDEPELVAELTQTTYSFKGDALLLEPKDVVKQKLGRSPDLPDSLALTFAAPVAKEARFNQMLLAQASPSQNTILMRA
jgi:hypothetical protein